MHRLLIAVLLFIPTAAVAAPRTYRELAYMLIDIINAAIGLVLVLAIVVYFWGVVTKLPALSKKGDTGELRTQLMWGLVALFVMFSIWGILRLVQNTLFAGSGAEIPSSSRNEREECVSFGGCSFGE